MLGLLLVEIGDPGPVRPWSDCSDNEEYEHDLKRGFVTWCFGADENLGTDDKANCASMSTLSSTKN
jgi:hypothetical protein